MRTSTPKSLEDVEKSGRNEKLKKRRENRKRRKEKVWDHFRRHCVAIWKSI